MDLSRIHLAVNLSLCQNNLIKTYHNEAANFQLITKIALDFFFDMCTLLRFHVQNSNLSYTALSPEMIIYLHTHLCGLCNTDNLLNCWHILRHLKV